MSKPIVRTYNVFPPIPIRSFDWIAYYQGEEDEHMAHGYGSTEQEAIDNLLLDYPREDVMTIAELQAALTIMLNNHCSPDYKVAVWIKEHGGKRAIDIGLGIPTADHNDQFIVFELRDNLL